MVELETKIGADIINKITLAQGDDFIALIKKRWVSLDSHNAALKELKDLNESKEKFGENQAFANGFDEGTREANTKFKALLAEQRKNESAIGVQKK